MQNLPDVMDIEVSPGSGEWRVVGSQGAWMSIREDPGQLLDARVLIKPEPQPGGAAPALAAAGGQPFSHLHTVLVCSHGAGALQQLGSATALSIHARGPSCGSIDHALLPMRQSCQVVSEG